MTILGLGTDIIELSRVEEAITRHGNRFLERLFTAKERDYCLSYQDSIPRFAGRFAAKEAVSKALGTGIGDISWHEIEIVNSKSGQPKVFFSKRLQALYPSIQVLLSISHCKAYATATAIIVEN